jgi:hypothetical protein
LILDQLEKVLMVIGDKVIMATGGLDNWGEDDDKIVTSELVIRPRQAPPRPQQETRRSLNDKTKQQICDQCLAEYGVELSQRTEKKLLITEYLKLQEE